MKLSIGTDCSGIEAPIQAMNKLIKKYDNLSYNHAFSSEIDPYAVSCIQENYDPDILYGDMQKRDLQTSVYHFMDWSANLSKWLANHY